MISPSAAVSAAVAAGLAALGWAAALPAPLPSGPLGGTDRPFKIVLVADDAGQLFDAVPTLRDGAEAVVLVAAPYAARSLVPALERALTVVDADLPLLTQLQAVDQALGSAPHIRDSAAAAASLRSWVDDVDRLDTLTARELDVLDLIMCGYSAEAVAAHLFVAVPTVRTHIRQILAKLEVGSQLAAAAVACRVRCGPGVRRCRSHQF